MNSRRIGTLAFCLVGALALVAWLRVPVQEKGRGAPVPEKKAEIPAAPPPVPAVPASVEEGERPSEALRRILDTLRSIHPDSRAARPDPATLARMRDATAALADLVQRFPEVGLDLYASVLKENDAELAAALSRFLRLSASPELNHALAAALAQGGPDGPPRVALRGLELRPQREANEAVLAAWKREGDPGFRAECVRVLTMNLSRSIRDDGIRTSLLDDLRASARTTLDPSRRLEAFQVIINGQPGARSGPDRILLDEHIERESNESTKAALIRLRDRIPSLIRTPGND